MLFIIWLVIKTNWKRKYQFNLLRNFFHKSCKFAKWSKIWVKTNIYLESGILKIHDCVWDADIQLQNNLFHIEWSSQPVGKTEQTVNKLVPLFLDLDVMGETALHHVEAVVVARLDVRVALARWAWVHLFNSCQTLFTGYNLGWKSKMFNFFILWWTLSLFLFKYPCYFFQNKQLIHTFI